MRPVSTVSVADAVLESAADAIIAVDRDLAVIMWNAAATRLFGWSASEMTGRVAPLVPEELAAEHNAVLERVCAGGHVSLVTRRIRRGGELIDVRIDTSALRDPEGELIGWVSVYHPVDEDEAARHHIAERARLVRRLTDVVAGINAELDLSSLLDRIVASLTELTGADAAGFSLIESDRLRLVSLTALPERLRGNSAHLASSLVGELLRSGKTVMMVTGEARSLHDLIWSELPGLHTIALGVSSVHGRPYGALYALYSKRRVGHTELELLELLAGHCGVALTNAMTYDEVVRQRAHERAVIDASADGIAVLDGDGRVRQWNPAARAITGYSAEDVVGVPPPFPLPEPGTAAVHRLPNGRWLEVLRAEIEETGEQVIDFRDVTQAKSLEEAKDLFLATASHELRTPITVVRGFAATLINRWEELSDAERRAAVGTIAERAGALGRLVEQLLLGSQAGTGELSVVNGPFDLARLLRDATAAFQPLSERHEVVLDVPGDLPLAHGDPLATDIVVGQLLENAFKYSPDGGTVTVRARAVGERIVVTVEDEGIGIAPGDRERIFERFVQGESGDRRRFGGIGLGLYIVRRLARAQHGEVSARCRSMRGTCLEFVLPRATATEPG